MAGETTMCMELDKPSKVLLMQVTDPDLKEACRGRRKSLKAVINTLQDGKSSSEDRQQQLIKILASQVHASRA